MAAQNADLSLKRKKANLYISTAVGLAAAQCVNPIPLSTQGIKVAGVTLATFLKSIFGVGTVAGVTINMLVATTLTATLGKTYALIMETVVTNNLDISNMDEKKWGETIKQITKKIKKDDSVFEFEGVE